MTHQRRVESRFLLLSSFPLMSPFEFTVLHPTGSFLARLKKISGAFPYHDPHFRDKLNGSDRIAKLTEIQPYLLNSRYNPTGRPLTIIVTRSPSTKAMTSDFHTHAMPWPNASAWFGERRPRQHTPPAAGPCASVWAIADRAVKLAACRGIITQQGNEPHAKTSVDGPQPCC